MKLFDKMDSKRLDKRLADLRGQLATTDAAIADRQEALEAALAEDRPSEKPLNDLALARTKAEALRSVISKADQELTLAKAREEREAVRVHLAALQKKVATLREDLSRKRSKLTEMCSALKAAEGDFNGSRGEVQEVMVEVGLQNILSILPYGAAFTGPAQPLNSPDANLAAALSRIDSTIDSALRAAGERSAEDAPAPEVSRRRFDLSNGQRVDEHGVPLDADGRALPIATVKAGRMPARSGEFAEI